jgi:hypothetical protein
VAELDLPGFAAREAPRAPRRMRDQNLVGDSLMVFARTEPTHFGWLGRHIDKA